MRLLRLVTQAYSAVRLLLLGAISSYISLLRGRRVTFSEFIEELDDLGLKGKPFGPQQYLRALEDYLGITINVTVIPDQDDAELRRAFLEEGHMAVSWYRPEWNIVHIFVLSSLSPLEMSAAVYHELSHVAAGHQLRTGPKRPGSRDTAKHYPRRLAKRPAPASEKNCEQEAALREEYCMLAGALGSACLENDDLRQPA